MHLQPTSLVSAPIFLYLLLYLFYFPSLLSLPISFFYLLLTPFYLPLLLSILPCLPSFSPSPSLLFLCFPQSFSISLFPPSFSSLSPFSSPHSPLYTAHSLPSILTFFMLPISLYLLYFCFTIDCRYTFIFPCFNAQRVM